MLKIDDLESFCEEFKQENLEIKEVFCLVDQNDYTHFVNSVVTDENQAILIAILPSANLDFKDKDNFKFLNFLNFLIVQKTETREGYKRYLSTFKFTQPLAADFFNFILAKSSKFGECVFKDFDFKSTGVDPVTDLSNTYGYSISIPLKTPNESKIS